MDRRHRTSSLLLICALAALPFSPALIADNFSIEGGLRNTIKGTSDFKQARKKDLMVQETGGTFSAGQPLSLAREDDKPGANSPFFSMFYRKDFSSFGLQVGLAYESFSGKYEYIADSVPSLNAGILSVAGTNGAFTQRELNRDLEIGLRLPIKAGVLFLTPRLGSRLSDLDVTGSELQFSQDSLSGLRIASISTQGVGFSGSARGNYEGLNLDWVLSEVVDLYASYTLLSGLSGHLNGNPGDNTASSVFMTGSKNAIAYSTAAIPLYWKSGYRVDGSILDAGLKWKIDEVFFIKTGYRLERTAVSYPGDLRYTGMISTGSGTATITTDAQEPISNALIYGRNQDRKWETLSLSIGANVDFNADR